MIYVFTGPTVPRDDALLSAPGIRVRPPVRHGDLFGLGRGDTAVLVDGVYHQAAALRHKEILAALASGVRVIGAASIGALRAAELEPFGVEGVGQVFDAVRSGLLTSDAEVAVGQDPNDATAVTWPLVNVREVLHAGMAAEVLTAADAQRLLVALGRVYYAQRSSAAMRAVCRREGAARFAQWLAEQRAADARFGDVKYADARLAVERALNRPGAPAEAGAGCWDSAYFRRWRAHFAVQSVDGAEIPTRLRVAYQQLFDPDFAEVWTMFLEQLSRFPGDGTGGMPVRERVSLHAGLPVDVLFRVEPQIYDEAVAAVLLARETAADRAALARYIAADERARREVAGFTAEAVRDDIAERILTAVWGCDEAGLDGQARARGLRSVGRAIDAVKAVAAGLLEDQARRREDTAKRVRADA